MASFTIRRPRSVAWYFSSGVVRAQNLIVATQDE